MVLEVLGYGSELVTFGDFVYFFVSAGLDIGLLIFVLNWCIGFFKSGGHR